MGEITEEQTRVLQRQQVEITFNNDGIYYFSLSTQHGKTDTLERAITYILEADQDYNSLTPLSYMIDKYSKKDIPKYEPVKEEDFKKYIEMLKENMLKDYE